MRIHHVFLCAPVLLSACDSPTAPGLKPDQQPYSQVQTGTVSSFGETYHPLIIQRTWTEDCRIGVVFFVYIARCADGTLYTGLARDPEKRVRIHNEGKGAKYTRSRLPVTLVYVEKCDSLSAALRREHEIKPWNRARKEALIAGA